MKLIPRAEVKAMLMTIYAVLKQILGLIKSAYSAIEYIRKYRKLQNAAPYTFTVIANAKKSGVATFTTGKVMSLTIWKVVIEGNQVEDLVVDGQVHEIPLYRIRGITEHKDVRSI